MAARRFLGCHSCAVMVPTPPPELRDAPEEVADMLLALSEFLVDHLFHPIAQFVRGDKDAIASRPFWDPLAEITFEINDGHEVYTATASRSAIDEPRRYRFAAGPLPALGAEVEIDVHDLRRSLDLEFYPHALRPTKVDNLIKVLNERIGGLDGAQLDIAFDAPDDPTVSIAAIPPDTLEAVIAASAAIFEPWELDKVIRFLRDNSHEDGLLALRIRRNRFAAGS